MYMHSLSFIVQYKKEIYVIHGNIITLQILCQYHIVFIQEIQPYMRPTYNQRTRQWHGPMDAFVKDLNTFVLQT